MQKYNGRLLFSAGDLNTFIGCRHATRLTFVRLSMEAPPALEEDEFGQLVAARGIAFEREHLAKLKARYGDENVCEVPTQGDLAARVEATRDAIEGGYRVIYQAQLLSGSWNGIADFLIRQEERSEGRWLYDIQDTKLALSVKPSHAVQLAVYADLLAAQQGEIPTQLSVVLGSGEQESVNTGEVIHYARDAARRFEDFMTQLQAGAAEETEAEPCAHCRNCTFASACEQSWQESDHLSLVAGIRKEHIAKLRAAGIVTLEALAQSQAPVQKLAPATYAKLRQQASLQIQGRQTPVFQMINAEPGRGFGRLPAPAEGDVFFDMEGDPLFPGGSLEYLFGAYTEEGGFHAFWARNRGEERDAFDRFMCWLDQHLQRYPQAFVYHYNHYEVTALRRLAGTYGLHEELVGRLIQAEQRFVDLYKVVREQLMVGEPGYSLKNLERFYRGARGEEVANAGDSVIKFETYCITGDGALLQQIEDYNKVDCESTCGLRDWLLRLRGTNANPPPWFMVSGLVPAQKKRARGACAGLR